ncbi:hypothetical protein OROGR_014332 [Orobanche gracilis]
MLCIVTSEAITNAEKKLLKNLYNQSIRQLGNEDLLESSAGALTNFEILDLLRSRGAGTDLSRVIASVSPSEYKVFDYLEQTAACNQTRDVIAKFVAECKIYDLAKAEILNVVNIRPSSPVELYAIIEEFESRMEDKIDEVVETIRRILPPHPSQKESTDDENVNEEEKEENVENKEEENLENEEETGN